MIRWPQLDSQAASISTRRARTLITHDRSRAASFLSRGMLALTVTALGFALACGPKGDSGNGLTISDGRIFAEVRAPRDTVFASASRIMAQERIALRRYEPRNNIAETGFIDLAAYPNFFDQTLWDDTERMIKLRLHTDVQDSITVLMCEPYYNPYEVVTHETDFTRLRLVPPGHPGFAVAMALTRRIAAHAEGRAVAAP
ncbi:MAG: hypothetical protein JSU87_11320 [Gemmatimonadota bacterium]|nr:MAG: hypothetical protein JSU87_11320 [Gemmatimonadota bacterium]